MDGIGTILSEHGWIWWILIGGLAGLIAKFLVPGRDPGGCIVTILLGIAGAVVSAATSSASAARATARACSPRSSER